MMDFPYIGFGLFLLVVGPVLGGLMTFVFLFSVPTEGDARGDAMRASFIAFLVGVAMAIGATLVLIGSSP